MRLLSVKGVEFTGGGKVLRQPAYVGEVHRLFVLLFHLDQISVDELFDMLRDSGLRVVKRSNKILIADRDHVLVLFQYELINFYSCGVREGIRYVRNEDGFCLVEQPCVFSKPHIQFARVIFSPESYYGPF